MAKIFHVYMLASGKNGTLYTGVTSNLAQRIQNHKSGTASAFTRRYNVTRLVLAEEYADATTAIAREKALKKWRRAWKIKLIEASNPHWQDLFPHL